MKFEPKNSAGDRVTVKIESSLTLELVTKDSEGEKKRVLTLDAQEEYRQEVLLVDGALPRRIKVKCERSARNKTIEGGAPQSWTTALQGATFLVTLGAPPKVELEGGGEVPAGGDAVGAWNAWARMLPKEAKNPGDSWKVDAGELSPALWADFEEPTGTIDVKLDRIENNRATLLLSGSVKGRTRDEFEGGLELGETSLVFDLAAGKPVSFFLSGKLELARRLVERRPKPGSLTEEIEVPLGSVTIKSTRMTVSVKFE